MRKKPVRIPHSDATKQKIRLAHKARVAAGTAIIPQGFVVGFDPRRTLKLESRIKAGKTNSTKLLLVYNNTKFEDLKPTQRRRRVIEEQNFSCLRCGNSEWLGVPITLELDHIDGNKKNEARENLRALCPNCHAQTETWRRRKSALRGRGLSGKWHTLRI